MARPGPNTGQPPISFRTVPGRHKTQKWTTAKTVDYGGDDWGGYDPYDEYGDEQQQQPLPPPQPPYAQQRPAQRQNSFDSGEERRALSGPGAYYGGSERGGSPARSAVSSGSGGRGSNDYERRRRDFTNPESVPPPLNTRASPAPGSAGYLPPRKSSASRASPAPDAVPPPSSAKEKELPTPPFIRPSDIYKRMAEAQQRERQSLDNSSRPSLEAISRESESPAGSSSGVGRRPLSSVEEAHQQESARSQQTVQVPQHFGEPPEQGSRRPELPNVQGVSNFGSDFLSRSGTSTGDDEQSPTTLRAAQSNPSSLQATPIATRAPPGSDPAAEILAERTATRAAPGSDPAADILAERTHAMPVSSIGLSHQPSQGYRSMVNKAFDPKDDSSNSIPATPVSRDGSLLGTGSGSGVSRSNTDSTSSISPIMSRVPSAATAQQRQQERDAHVPTIAEEPQQQQHQGGDMYRIPRKPSPGHSRNTSAETAKPEDTGAFVPPSYRRSLDPPSADNSPARTPGLENAHSRRLSGPMAAETVTPPVEHDAEPPAVEDQGVEMQPALQRTGTDWSEYSQSMYSQSVSSPTTGGRARAGTDYSMREADRADTVNSSPDKAEFDAQQAAEAQRERDDFLKQHSDEASPVNGPGSARAASPAKGRVRDLVDNYTELHDSSRRNSATSSKSSWSDFRGSEENLPATLKKKGTAGSSDLEPGGAPVQDGGRPEMGREQSFRPQLPGQWVSFVGTPSETPPPVSEPEPVATPPEEETRQLSAETSPLTPTDSRTGPPVSEKPVDLTPTTKKFPLSGSHSPPQARSPTSPNSAHANGGAAFSQAKNAGDALGASLVASHGLGHQTRDFGSAAPAAPVDQPETAFRAPTGALGYWQPPSRPELNRGETDASLATATSEVPPTPPAKDGESTDRGLGGRPVSNYFSGAPLRTGRSREASPETDVGAGGFLRPTALSTALSTDTGRSDLESDRLRKEIVRSLDGGNARQEDSPQAEDTERTQDALDAPDNMSRVEDGEKALPAAEIAGAEKPLPRMLDQRFSWEHLPQDRGALASSPAPVPGDLAMPPDIKEPELESSPEIKPEMPYERPRSRGLHIVNADDESSDEEVRPAGVSGSHVAERGLTSGGPVSPITKSQENLHAARTVEEREAAGEGSDLPELVPSPLSDTEPISRFLPSYYTQDALSVEPPTSHEAIASAAADATPDATPQSPAEQKIVDDTQTPTPTTPTKNKKIPPFREILAIKTPADRIRTYDETRQTFADMDTGLADWLSGMLAQHPEHASLSTSAGGYRPPALQTSGTMTRGHKHAPSLAKFTKNFNIPGAGERKASMDAGGRSAGGSGAGADVPPKTPAKDFSVPNVDMDKMQQRGKDLMKGAGVLGGKAQAGAKGLLAKGRSRFGTQRESKGGGGSSKAVLPASSSLSSSSTSTSTPPPPPPPPPKEDTASLTPLPSTVLPEPSAPSLAPPTAQHSSTSPSPSPVPRPSFLQSKTPSSSSLSRTLSRLRERSRSKSTSRSKSRPTSLVLTNPDLVTLEDASPGAAAVSDAAVSPWAEPDGVAAFHPIERSVTPGRLGVLPSPAAETFSIIDESPTRTVGGSEKERDGGQRPSHARKSSDLASLPSQQKSLGFSPRSPPFSRREDDEDEDEDDLYTSTPVAAKARSPRSPTFGNRIAGEDDDSTPIASKTTSVALPKEAETPEELQESPAIATKSAGQPPLDIEPGADDQNSITELSHDGMPPEHAAIAGAEKHEALPQREVSDTDAVAAIATQSSDPDVSRPSTADDWEKRSEISAAGDFHDAREGVETEDETKAPSRRSSVSSLDSPGVSGARTTITAFVSASQTEMQQPVMSSQAAPAGPIGPSQHDPRVQQSPYHTPGRIDSAVPQPISRHSTPQQQRFMNRPYLFRDAQEERPRSYVSLERDASGNLVQESLNTTTQPSTASVDLSGLTGPPTGTPPFQQHPGLRSSPVGNTQPTEYERLRSPLFSGTKPMMRSRRPSVDAADRASKRFSGFFRGKDQRPTATVDGPAPSAITDSYGLEGLHSDDSNLAGGGPMPQQDPKQARRGSKIWETFKRTPSVKGPDLSRGSSMGKLDSQLGAANKARESSTRPNTLRKPERAASAATQSEPKKKRFSRLGSLFGRSSTTGHNSEKATRLTETQQPSVEFSQKAGPVPGQDAKGYNAYEAKRRQQIPDLQQKRPNNTHPPLARHVQGSLPPPPEGWYTPSEKQPRATSGPQGQPPSQQFRKLHSEGFRRDTPFSHVPEAFRPIEVSYGRAAAPVGPPPEEFLPQMYSPPTSPIGPGAPFEQPFYPNQPPFSQPPMPGLPHRRQSSSSSAEYQLSPQISGQSEFQRSDWRPRGSSPSISPVNTGSEGYMPEHAARVGSISEEIARSPAHAYTEQQTPWAISMPQGGDGSQRSSRASSWGMQGGVARPQRGEDVQGRGFGNVAPHADYYQPQHGSPMSPQSPAAAMPTRYPSATPPPPVMAHAPSYHEPQMRDLRSAEGKGYPSPPYSPETSFYGPPQRPPQGRYYAQPSINQGPPPPPKLPYGPPRRFSGNGPPTYHQRTPSGYTGRRDDPAVSEEALDMRGASYPGQEWSPRQWD